MLIGISIGSTGNGVKAVLQSLFGGGADSILNTIVWQIRFPRVLLAALVGATLSLGGLVFQALLRNPLAEPYILGISGGSAIGAIIGILAGLSRFPGVSFTAFLGSIATLLLLLIMSSGQSILKKNTLLLSGVMVNAFCGAIIMFLVSMTQDSRLHNIIFWLMGDLSMSDIGQVGILALTLLPCFIILFRYSHSMNLLLMGNEMAQTMGVNIKRVTTILLVVTSFMVSSTVCHCGLLGFVGLVMPHLLRLILGPDHRVLVPACILGGGAYMVICDLLARTFPQQGEMPAGVITAMIGAPLFIYLLKRSKR
ncbi:MAG: iron ABC transporter permease [Desulfobacterales bacterium]|uniref:Iron ABC transporter permease n=1 Tax=Candidatus Desulfaltia bathyphila TaxID=2841697 RepID=A0A8J6N3C9_9BACT|nr:iron ABC transporter permease [Candidatus Desulfaltia bathyphila]MBL7194714.1 iron ABC transporter permease [Desulfobacterales bacterium]MBL7207318.1 iron ABC transporter permease [Desulfobacterales bacterium]